MARPPHADDETRNRPIPRPAQYRSGRRHRSRRWTDAVPTWYEYRRGEVALITDATAFKCKCLRRDPRVTLCVDSRKSPYKAVLLKGRATLEETVADALMERMSIAYMGKKAGREYAQQFKGDPVVVVRFKPDHIVSWDYSKDG